MGVLGFLQFSLNCVELFAWPILALAYPLFASIRAIETNSNYHMKKLVTYWIIFSLISLFELTFVKLLEWFTIWPYMKIIAICWLVMPRFGHAYNAYKSIIQMSSLNVKMQDVINWLVKQDKENFVETEENYMSVVKKFIKENGSEALEELISNKPKVTKTNLDAKEKTGVTVTGKKEKATPVEAKESKAKVAENEIKTAEFVEMKEKNKTSTTKIPYSSSDAKEKTGVKVTGKKEKATPVEVKESKAKVAENEIKTAEFVEMKEKNKTSTTKLPSSSSDNVQKHWSCAVCQVTTTSQTTLNSHLQGQKHIAKCVELKAKKEARKEKYSGEAKRNANENLSGDRVNQNKSTKQHEKKHRCSICDVNCTGETDFDSHLKGKKHLYMVQQLVASFRGSLT